MHCSWDPACKPEKSIFTIIDYRDPYMSAHVLLNLLNEPQHVISNNVAFWHE